MEAALVLTAEGAERAGYVGDGPFTFPGFPGVYLVDRPVGVKHLGLGDEPVEDAVRRVFGEDPPLAMVQAAPEDAEPLRENHAPSQAEVDALRVDEAVEDKAGGRVTTHAEADRVARELGFEFPSEPRPRLEAKLGVIDAVRAGADPGQALAQLSAEDEESG